MSTYNAGKLLDYLSEHTEAFLNKAVTEWQTLPHSVFSHKVSQEKWSANQCIEHLNSYGRYYLPQIEKVMSLKVGKPGSPEDFKAGWLGDYFTKMMLTDANGQPTKKMSAPKDHNPQVQKDVHLVIAEFIEQQEKMLSLLNDARQVDIGNTRIPISIAKFIKLKLGDTFLFNIAHNYRHILQAGRALENAGVASTKLASFSLEEINR